MRHRVMYVYVNICVWLTECASAKYGLRLPDIEGWFFHYIRLLIRMVYFSSFPSNNSPHTSSSLLTQMCIYERLNREI